MGFKSHKHLIILFLAFAATILGYAWFIHSAYFAGFQLWAQSNIFLYVSLLVLIKVVGIIWPPIPGGVLTLGSIPVLGWQVAYASDLAGSVIGSSVAYFLAKKYGQNLMKKLFDADAIAKIMKIKIKPKREIESIFLLRIFGGNVVEVICYGAGILGVGFRNFFIGTVLSHLALGIPVFYFAGGIFDRNRILVNFVFVASTMLIFYKLRHRYFEYA